MSTRTRSRMDVPQFDRRYSLIATAASAHDRGTGITATGASARMAGADRVEVPCSANGERTRNVDVVTLVLNMYTQATRLTSTDINRKKDVYEYSNQPRIAERHPPMLAEP